MAALVTAAANLSVPERQMDVCPSGVSPIDLSIGGVPRGAITELTGGRSSGRTSSALAVLAEATQRQECCAYVDAAGCLDPASASRSGVNLSLFLWIGCNRKIDVALKSADLLLHAGGFGVICLDLGGLSPRHLNQIPISYWFRFRRAVEHTPTILLVLGDVPLARSCAPVWLCFDKPAPRWSGRHPGRLFRGLAAGLSVRKPGAPRTFSLPIAA